MIYNVFFVRCTSFFVISSKNKVQRKTNSIIELITIQNDKRHSGFGMAFFIVVARYFQSAFNLEKIHEFLQSVHRLSSDLYNDLITVSASW